MSVKACVSVVLVIRGSRMGVALALAAGLAAGAAPPSDGSGPIQLHPENPHYLLWRGRPTLLITSGEHYGAVLNLDFDYRRYLDELKTHGFNLTRTFSGTYREVIPESPPVGIPAGDAPRATEPSVRALSEVGHAYAVHVLGGTRAVLEFDLPAGSYRAEWVNTRAGSVERSEEFAHAGGPRTLNSPAYVEDIALRLKRTDAEGSPVGKAQPSRTRP